MVKRQQQYESASQGDSQLQNEKYHPNNRYQSDDSQSSSQNNQHEFQDDDIQQEDSHEVEQKLSRLQKEEQRIKQQLKQLPYGLILKQRQQLQKQKSQITQKIAKKKHINKPNQNKNFHATKQPKDKHAPKEMSIHKKPLKKVPVIFESSRAKSIDPRFEDYAGHYNQDLAKKTMDFIPKLQEEEIKAIRKTLDQSKSVKKNGRNKKKLTEQERKVLVQEYNRLTNQKRQNELNDIEKQARRNVRNQQNNHNNNRMNNNSNNNNYHNNQSGFSKKPFIPKHKFKQQFEKVKQSRMSEDQRKEYLKNKEKKIYKNQQIDRNNMMYEASRRFRTKNNGGRN